MAAIVVEEDRIRTTPAEAARIGALGGLSSGLSSGLPAGFRSDADVVILGYD